MHSRFCGVLWIVIACCSMRCFCVGVGCVERLNGLGGGILSGVRMRSKRRSRPPYVDGKGFHEARLIAGFDRNGAAAVLGVSQRTVRNWEARRCRVPYSAFKLMRILSGYALPGEAWQGWSVRGDTLWSPEQRGFCVHDLSWWGLTVGMARAWLHRERARSVTASTWRASKPVAKIVLTVGDIAPSL